MAEKPQKRQHFRVVYPLAEPAKVQLLFGTYPVVDLSASGICIRPGKDFERLAARKKEVTMILHLPSEVRLELKARLYRLAKGNLVYIFSTEIPLSIMIAEEIRLRKSKVST